MTRVMDHHLLRQENTKSLRSRSQTRKTSSEEEGKIKSSKDGNEIAKISFFLCYVPEVESEELKAQVSRRNHGARNTTNSDIRDDEANGGEEVLEPKQATFEIQGGKPQKTP